MSGIWQPQQNVRDLATPAKCQGLGNPSRMGYVCVQSLAGEIQAAGGIVNPQDLLSAQPVVKQPITAQVHNANPCYVVRNMLNVVRNCDP